MIVYACPLILRQGTPLFNGSAHRFSPAAIWNRLRMWNLLRALVNTNQTWLKSLDLETLLPGNQKAIEAMFNGFEERRFLLKE